MKDKEWLAEKGAAVEVSDKKLHSYQDGFNFAKEIFMGLIDQLDESETLSQEWVDEHAKAVTYDGILDQTEVVYVDELKKLIVEPNENQIVITKPEIPQFVADWYETYLEQGGTKLDVLGTLTPADISGVSHVDHDVYNWVKKNLTQFLVAISYDYTVQDEQKYIAYLGARGQGGQYNCVYLFKGVQTGKIYSGFRSSWFDPKLKRFHLTESEIKGFNERFWGIAKKVDEC